MTPTPVFVDAYGPTLAAVETEETERSLRAFVAQAWHVVEPSTPFKPNWHVDAICTHLEAVVAGSIRNLLINMPPRMMKSLTVSVFFPAWRWLRAPWTRFLYASYSQTLATDHSLATRRVIESDWYQERWGDRYALAGDQNLKTRFENDQRGARVSTSVGGTGTGLGGDVIVVDDPHNVREAESDAIREATLLWWDQAMSTRLNDPKTGARVVVMQRVHERDLSGHILEQGGYDYLCLPMEYEPTDRVTGIGWRDPRTEPGQLLAPDRFGPAEVAEAKIRLGSYGYAGQMQQRPAPAQGGILKRHWWRFWHELAHPLPPVLVRLPGGAFHACPCVPLPAAFDARCQSWDMSFKDATTSSYVVGQVLGRAGADAFLLAQVREQLDMPGSVAAVRALSAAWPGVTAKYVEDKANGPAVIATLKHEIPGLIPVEPGGGKAARGHAAAPTIEAGNVYLPHPAIAPWVNDLIEEAVRYPTGAHTDQVDALIQGVSKLLIDGGELVIPYIPPPIGFTAESTWAGAGGSGVGSTWDPSARGFGGPTGSGWGW